LNNHGLNFIGSVTKIKYLGSIEGLYYLLMNTIIPLKNNLYFVNDNKK